VVAAADLLPARQMQALSLSVYRLRAGGDLVFVEAIVIADPAFLSGEDAEQGSPQPSVAAAIPKSRDAARL